MKIPKSFLSAKNVSEHLVVLWFAFSYFLNYSAYFVYIPFSVYLSIGLVLSMPAFILNLGFYRKYLDKVWLIYFLFFIIMSFLSLYYTPAPIYGYEKVFLLFSWILLTFFSLSSIVNNITKFYIYNVIFGLVFIGLLISEYGNPYTYFQNVSFNHIRLGDQDINEDVASLNPIWVARYLASTVIMVLLFPGKGRFFACVKFAVLSISFVFMLASASKGPILSLFIALFSIYFQKINAKKIILFSLATFFFVILLSNIESDSFLGSRFSFSNEAATERMDFQIKVLESMTPMSMLFGNGVGSTGFVLTGFDHRAYPHNFLLEVLFEYGIIAVVVTLVFISTLTIRSFNYYQGSMAFKITFALFLFYFINSQFSGDLSSNRFVFIFIFILSCLHNLQLFQKPSLGQSH